MSGRLGAALLAAVAIWAASGTLAVTAPDGPRIGLLPPVWVLAIVAAATAALALVLRGGRDWLVLLAPAVWLLPWLPVPVPAAFLVWTGPFVALVGAAVLLALAFQGIRRSTPRWPAAVTDPRRAPLVVAVVSIVLYGAAAWRVAPMIPGGDEPHYLIITQSLLYDGDLKIENNHLRGDHRAYVAMDLKPDYIARGRDGEIYSIHMPGVSALVAPAFLVAGHPGAAMFIVLLGAWAGALLWALASRLTAHAGAAWFAWAVAGLSTPVVFHSFAIYPDGAALPFVLVGVLALLRASDASEGSRPRLGRWFLYGAALALLPWLHSRLALVAGVLGVLILLRLAAHPGLLRRGIAFLSIPVASALGWFGFFYTTYGSFDPRAQYGRLLDQISSPAYITSGIGGLLFDQQFGLLAHAPAFACALAGLVVMLRLRGRTGVFSGDSPARLALELLLLLVPYLVSTTTMRMWWGGWSAPARFLVPLLPPLALAAAFAWQRAERRATRAVMLGALAWSAAMTGALVWVARGRLAYDVRQTDALWLEWAGPLADLMRGVPTFLRTPEPVAWAQVAVWVGALGGAWLIVRALEGRVFARRASVGLALAGSFAAAGMLALTVIWRTNGVTGVEPALAQLDLLRASGQRNWLGVGYEPLAYIPRAEVPARVTIAPPARYASPRDREVMALPGPIPAGTYVLQATGALSSLNDQPREPSTGPDGQLSAGIRAEFAPLEEASFVDGSPELTLHLPVDVHSLAVRGDEAAFARVEGMLVRPRAILPAGRALADGVAARARRYAGVRVFFMDRDTWPEPEAFWIRGASRARVVLQPEVPRASVSLFLRNAPVENTLLVEAGQWTEELRLAPGEERRIAVPLDAVRGAGLVRFTVSGGFRPSEVEPTSQDHRFLGVWVQPLD